MNKLFAPMLVPLAGLIAGITAGMNGCGLFISISLCFLSIGIYMLVSRLSLNPVKGFVLNRYHYIWIFILFAAVGLADYDFSRPYELQDKPDTFVAAQGKVRNISSKVLGDRLLVDVIQIYDKNKKSFSTSSRFPIILNTDAVSLDVDDIIVFPLNLKEIRDSQSSFDNGYSSYLHGKGIYYESHCEGYQIQTINHVTSLTGIAESIREKIEISIEKSPLNKRTSNFIISILLGDRAFLDSELRRNFADAGISHILALSGMHIAIIAGILMWLLFPLNFFGRYRLRMLIAGIAIFLYTFITGWSPATVRASVMIGVIILCVYLERKNSTWNALLFACFLVLLFSPLSLRDAGFQMSFLCVASLIFFTTPFNKINHHDHPKLYNVASIVLATLAATLGTWCLSAYYFGIVPVAFLTANILFLPIIPTYLIGSIVYLILISCGIEIALFGKLLDYSFNFFEKAIAYISADGTSALLFSPGIISVIAWLLVLVSIIFVINGHRRNTWIIISLSCSALFVLSLFIPSESYVRDGLIIKSSNGPITILTRCHGVDKEIRLKRGVVSEFNFSNMKFLIVDGELPEKSFSSANYQGIIIGGNFKGDINMIINKINTKEVITYPTLRKKREVEIISRLDSAGIAAHSIRLDGPRRIIR